MAYARVVKGFFDWCDDHHLRLEDIEPIAISAYIEELGAEIAKPSVKQHLAAIRQLFDYLVTGGILVSTPAGSVRGPKFVVTCGKTPVLSGAEMRQLLKSIDTSELIGLRDRALLGLMGYSFACVGAVAILRAEDYFQQGRLGRDHAPTGSTRSIYSRRMVSGLRPSGCICRLYSGRRKLRIDRIDRDLILYTIMVCRDCVGPWCSRHPPWNTWPSARPTPMT
jgi:hypothetical protein